jgi:hypothetical protein
MALQFLVMQIFNACVDQAPMIINLACYIFCIFCRSQGMPNINGCDVQT